MSHAIAVMTAGFLLSKQLFHILFGGGAHAIWLVLRCACTWTPVQALHKKSAVLTLVDSLKYLHRPVSSLPETPSLTNLSKTIGKTIVRCVIMCMQHVRAGRSFFSCGDSQLMHVYRGSVHACRLAPCEWIVMIHKHGQQPATANSKRKAYCMLKLHETCLVFLRDVKAGQ